MTQGKGFDTRDHVLACFGGAGKLFFHLISSKKNCLYIIFSWNSYFQVKLTSQFHVKKIIFSLGGQHACAIARSLGMSTVYIHKYAGILR